MPRSGDVMTGSEQVLVEDWCQQYPSHSTGTVEFGADGKLYASGGDGASFNLVDYGQDGNPSTPAASRPGGVGATLSPPTAEGGALRRQDLRTSGDPVSLDGSIIRVDPATGAAPADNPLVSDPDANAKRIIAYGQRNPFRPGTNELWAGDVGWNTWEEINRGSSSIAGLDFQFAASTTNYPAEYDGALFFADYSRDCIWVMHKGSNGLPAPGQIRTFVAGAANPVNPGDRGQGATSSTRTSTTGRSGASGTPPA
jgi:hypothetical protein